MTTMVDESSDTPCPRSGWGQDDGVVVVSDRNTELKLMDSDSSTCVAMYAQGKIFWRVVAFIYIPNSVYTVPLILEISGTECTHPGLVVYHVQGDILMECRLQIARHAGAVQRCEFVCTHIFPNESVLEIYIQTRWVSVMQNDSASICKIELKN